jgi:cell division GTPase FtsZ
MDRRHFLRTINTLGIGAVLPVSARNELRVGVVGVGGAGGNVLIYLAERLPNLGRTIAISTHTESLYRRKVAVTNILS